MSDSLQPLGLYPTRLLCPWNFPGKNTGVGCYFLLQGIFPTQGLNPGLLHCRQMLYHLSHQGSPKGKPVIYEKKKKWGDEGEDMLLQALAELTVPAPPAVMPIYPPLPVPLVLCFVI